MSQATAIVLALVLSAACWTAHAQTPPVPSGLDGGAVAANSSLGATCEEDRDCGPGLLCLSARADGGAAPSGGLCTLRCDDEDTETCTALGGGAGCVALELGDARSGSSCMRGCSSEARDQCQGRRDLACSYGGGAIRTTQPCTERDDCISATVVVPGPFTLGDAYCCDEPVGTQGCTPGRCVHDAEVCVPTCSRDDGCPADLRCNPATGLCDGVGRVGAPPGADCSSPCAGTCGTPGSSTQGGAMYCEERCVIGQPCGPPSATNARCFSPFPFSAVGAVGTCSILCNCDSDCAELGERFTCVIHDSEAVAVLGFRGRCRQTGESPLALGERECSGTRSESCSAGDTRACIGAGDCLGVSECTAEGEYGECMCPDGGAMIATDSGLPPPDAGVRGDGGTRVPKPAQSGSSCTVTHSSLADRATAMTWLLCATAAAAAAATARLRRRRRSPQHP